MTATDWGWDGEAWTERIGRMSALVIGDKPLFGCGTSRFTPKGGGWITGEGAFLLQ
jgi:hypothetical protein